MKSSSDKIYQDQAYLIYYGRVTYNHNKDGNETNIFRNNGLVPKLAAEVKRSFSYDCKNISEAIFLKRIVDISILDEIQVIGKNDICNSTYTNYFIFPSFSSNIENYYFSKNGLKIAHIGSLSSYSQINFSCFDKFSNTAIKNVLISPHTASSIDNDASLKLSQMISLFLCETSRNPTAFFTIPMCLEIGERLFETLQNKTERDILIFKNAIKDIHDNSSIYKSLTVRKEELEKTVSVEGNNKEFKKLVKEINSKFIDIEHLDIHLILKSDVIKDVIINLFPMSMAKAVPASRYISNEINTKLGIDFNSVIHHQYDYDKGSIQDAVNLLNTERCLIDAYKKLIANTEDNKETVSILNDIARNWFNLELSINDDFYEGNLSEIKNWLVELSGEFNDIMMDIS